jgi:glucosyl-dolichyl phosphate glucuronosyltransferase
MKIKSFSQDTHSVKTMLLASVIIPSYKRARYLFDTLESISRQEVTGEFEIIVVDNMPTEELRLKIEALRTSELPLLRYIAEPRTGLHYARHAGAKAARSEILVFSEDDMYVRSGWLAALLQPYEDSLVVCVGGKCQPCWEAPPPDWLEEVPRGYLSLLDYGDESRELSKGEYINGGNMSVRKQFFFEVGGFNPDGFGDRRLIWYRGDGEIGLQRRIHAAGYQIIYTPLAVMEHRTPPERMTATYLRRRAFDSGIEENYKYYRYRRPSLGGLLFRSAYLAAKYIRHSLRYQIAQMLGHTSRSLKISLELESCKGQLLHTIRLLFQPALRRHCLKNNYLDE